MGAPVVLQKHEPERRRKSVTTLHCGCTCCCCCCLHTIGSIVGAAVAPAIGTGGGSMPMTYYYDDEIDAQVPVIRKPSFSSITFFWWLTCLLIFGCFAIGILQEGRGGENVIITAVIVLMILPGLQLVSAITTLIVYAVWPRPDKSQQLGKVGKILGGVVIGALLGTLAMAGFGFGLAALSK